jgi:two-component system sensor histidine kinase PilS (NtrC family)
MWSVDHKINNSPIILVTRAALYLAIVFFIVVYYPILFIADNSEHSHVLFTLIFLSASLQFVYSFKLTSIHQIFSLFLADSAVAMYLVKTTGASASPFLLLFPLLSLGSAIILKTLWMPWIVAASSSLLMSFAVGFGPSIFGNVFAILVTTYLGQYLARLLEKTDRALVKSEGARKRLENLQKAILQNIPSGLMSIDTAGKIIQINPVGLQILGKAEYEVLGYFLSDLMPELDKLRDKLHTLVPVLDHLRRETDRKVVEFSSAKGKMKLGYSLARLYDPEDKSPIGTLVVFQDLTHIMELEETLRLNEKLAAVGKLAAGIAHEIRNPLASISGCAQLLIGTPNLDQEDQKMLNIIQSESQRLDNLITEFLDYVRPPQLKFEKVDLKALITRIKESFQLNPKWLELKCEIICNFPDSDVIALGEPNKLTQVLMNFILNAGQAGAHRVTLSLESPAKLSIKDDGSGIPKDIQSRIYEPFFTTKEKGTGLGLAISYKLLESMGAAVRLESPLIELGNQKGTQFTIDFRGASTRNENIAV